MQDPQHAYRLLADAVLLLHFAVVVFVVGGLIAVFVGNAKNWRWVNSPAFRIAHVLAIGVVVVQSWLGQLCPLTILESWLREQAGEAAYAASFVEHWVQRVLYYEGPLWSDPDNGLFVQYLREGKIPGATSIDEVRAAYEAKVPMGRGCTPHDVVEAILYLVSQQYETGQALPVTGGQVMLS